MVTKLATDTKLSGVGEKCGCHWCPTACKFVHFNETCFVKIFSKYGRLFFYSLTSVYIQEVTYLTYPFFLQYLPVIKLTEWTM